MCRWLSFPKWPGSRAGHTFPVQRWEAAAPCGVLSTLGQGSFSCGSSGPAPL